MSLYKQWGVTHYIFNVIVLTLLKKSFWWLHHKIFHIYFIESLAREVPRAKTCYWSTIIYIFFLNFYNLFQPIRNRLDPGVFSEVIIIHWFKCVDRESNLSCTVKHVVCCLPSHLKVNLRPINLSYKPTYTFQSLL